MKKVSYIIAMILFASPLFAQVVINPVANLTSDQHETAIAVSPINPKYMIATWNDFQSNIRSQAGYAISSDGGLNWFKIDTITGINRHPFRFGFDPSCGFDRYGNTYYCYNTYRNDNGGRGPVYISKSPDYGINWQHILVSVNYEYNQDKPYMAVDNTGGLYT